MTSGPDRSLTGISLPKWMKSKIVDRAFDFEENAFSPPTGDDGFFMGRFKKTPGQDEMAGQQQQQPRTVTASSSILPSQSVLRNFDCNNPDDVSKHTPACQHYISNSKFASREVSFRNKLDSEGSAKSAGTEDNLKSEGAACGYSVVAVAHQMLAERNVSGEKLVIPASQRVRRNSKSLPASPLSSPKLARKNPYFTSVLFGSTEKVSSEKSGGSLGKGASMEGSADDLLGRLDSETFANLRAPSRILRAKPSELREMNFWSPTSM